MFQITLLDGSELRIADVSADTENQARSQCPDRKVLFVHRIGNPGALEKWPLRRRRPAQTEMEV